MNNKLRLIMCCLILCVLIPINTMFASGITDRYEEGINIDDIVYHLSQPNSLSNLEVRALLNQILPIHTPTVAEVAAGITSVTAPLPGATTLELPSVPTGYQITIKDSTIPGVIGTDGSITPPVAATSVQLVFAVTRTSGITTANTIAISVVVPASGPLGYTYCAIEGEFSMCNFSGTADVAFGANGSYFYVYNTTSVSCTHVPFGGDPISGVVKACYYKMP